MADRGNDRVQQFDATGRYVDKFIGDATPGRAARYLVSTNPDKETAELPCST